MVRDIPTFRSKTKVCTCCWANISQQRITHISFSLVLYVRPVVMEIYLSTNTLVRLSSTKRLQTWIWPFSGVREFLDKFEPRCFPALCHGFILGWEAENSPHLNGLMSECKWWNLFYTEVKKLGLYNLV
jgi:hypothetical protein